MAITGWYVLYRDGPGHSIREADGFDAAIVAAWQLNRDGRDVVQIGPLDKKRANEVIVQPVIGRQRDDRIRQWVLPSCTLQGRRC